MPRDPDWQPWWRRCLICTPPTGNFLPYWFVRRHLDRVKRSFGD